MYGFRLADHFTRLRESMKMMRINVPYSDDDLFEAVRTVISGNELREDIHMHMVAYVGAPGLDATTQTGLYINPRKRPRVMEGNGLKCNVSSWTRTSDNAIPIRLKSGSNYQNGRLAILQSKADGYDQPILLNRHGKVAEGSGATFFMVRKGRIVTPTTSSDILESITRTTLIEYICPEVLGMDVVERDIDRTELYVAEEAFFCGSGYEITPILSIDRFNARQRRGGPGDEAHLRRRTWTWCAASTASTRSGARRRTSPFTFERGGPRNGPPHPPHPEARPGSAGACFEGACPATRRTRRHASSIGTARS